MNLWNSEILRGIRIAKDFTMELESRKFLKVEIKFSKVRKSVTKRLIIPIKSVIIEKNIQHCFLAKKIPMAH